MSEYLGYTPEIFLTERGRTREEKILLGRDEFVLSTEAQKYFTLQERSTYPCDRSILIVNEPHQSLKGHYNLIDGLEQFFKDNHYQGTNNMAFLAEGVESGKRLSVKNLQKMTKHPTAGEKKAVIDSYSMPGYMVYAWEKFRQKIDIIGIEDKSLYQLGRSLMDIMERLGILQLEDNEAFRYTEYQFWLWTVIARNQEIGSRAYYASASHKNTLLFMGALHLHIPGDELVKALDEKFKTEAKRPGSQIEKASEIIEKAYLTDVSRFLQFNRIGYTLISPKGYEEDIQTENASYAAYFRHQAEGKRKLSQKELDDIANNSEIKNTTIRRNTTIEPSLSTSEAIMHNRQEDYKDWHEVDQKDVERATGRKSLWDNWSPVGRGRDYEEAREANIAGNHRVVDHVYANAGVVASLKTMNTFDSSYQRPGAVYGRGQSYVDSFFGDKFQGVNWGGYTLAPEDVKGRILEIGIPKWGYSSSQQEELYSVQDYGRSRGVWVNILEVK